MGTGGSVNVSSEDVTKWLNGELGHLNDMGNAALATFAKGAQPSDALVLASAAFPHVAHQDDFGVTGNVSAEIAMIADAVFGNGSHPSVTIPQRDQQPVLRAMQVRIDNPSEGPIGDVVMQPSAAVLVVGRACAMFGELLDDWSATVQRWIAMAQPVEVTGETNRQSDLGAGHYLVGYHYSRCGPGIDTTNTGKSYVETTFAFTLIYSHKSFLQYEQGLDMDLIAKLKKELQDKRDSATMTFRSAEIDSSGMSLAPMHSAMAQFWSDALQIMSDTEQRSNAA
jgi:hypothetical protein